MSKFESAVFILKTTDHPLFVAMWASQTALPMAKGTREKVSAALPSNAWEHDRRVIESAVMLLTRSTRYLQACVQPGALRYDIDGKIVGPVSENEQKWATAMLARKEKFAREMAQRNARAKAKKAALTDEVGAVASDVST